MGMVDASDVVELLSWLEQSRIDVWLNGGWGVDALLGHQTRGHEDLDITISAVDRTAFTTAVGARGRMVDVHLVDVSTTTVRESGLGTYGPAGLPFEVGSLEGRGTIAGKSVRCETAEFQVRGHTGYTPDATDYRDVLALCRAFGIAIPPVFERLGFRRP
jgi:lincosamide nucleotidyltransferase A/C/D/E